MPPATSQRSSRGDFFRLFGADPQGVGNDLDVFVTAAREVHDEVLPRPDLFSHLLGVEDGVSRLECRDDAFEPRTESKRSERLVVGDARVLGESFVFEVGVLWAGSRVVKAGGDRVRLPDLAPLRLQDVAKGAVQNAQLALRERRPMLSRRKPPTRSLHAHEPHALSSEERVKGTDGVRPRADARDDRVWIAAETLSTLYLYLPADNSLEVAHDSGVRARAYDAPYDVMRVLDVRDPVSYRFVHRVLERP